MSRLGPVDREKLNPREQRLYDEAVRRRPRKTLSGPFAIWIHSPDIAEPADRLATFFRSETKLDKRAIELIVLMMCREATVKYAWSVHEPLARQVGLRPSIIEAVRGRRRPDFTPDEASMAVVFDVVQELIATRALSTATYERAIAALGREQMIEAVTCAGYYGMVGVVLNAFDVPSQSDDVLS